MPWDPSSRVVAEPSTPLHELPLSPGEFFVLSRLDAPVKVADLLRSCGLPLPEAEAALEKLVRLGAVKVLAALPEPPPRPRPPANGAVAERKRQTLVAQLAAARTRPEPPPPAPPPPAPTPQAEPSQSEAPAAEGGPPPPWPRVGARDPRLQSSLAISIEEQQRILALVDKLEDLSPYEILGIWPTHDMRTIRRAYHEVSRDFHPDSYFGQGVGAFSEHLAVLFRRATQAHEALRSAEIRAPFVDAEIARRAELARRAKQVDDVVRQQNELREAQAEAEAAARRHERATRRAARQREALDAAMRVQLDAYVQEAVAAEQAGNLARAANARRMALQLVPQDATLRDNWNRCLEVARSKRAAQAFERAMTLREIGQVAEAVPLLVEAAVAHPTVDNLVHAAEAIAPKDKVQARQFALGALEALRAEDIAGTNKRRPSDLARLHVMLARAFLAVGQQHTAREQASIADRHRPGDPEIRALLNSIKLP
jgi:tetratricopeptide (TPR) repeat protein